MISIANKYFTKSPVFARAYNKLCEVSVPTEEKLSLVKLRRAVAQHSEDLRSVEEATGEQIDPEHVQAFDFNPLDVNLVIDLLSATDICILADAGIITGV